MYTGEGSTTGNVRNRTLLFLLCHSPFLPHHPSGAACWEIWLSVERIMKGFHMKPESGWDTLTPHPSSSFPLHLLIIRLRVMYQVTGHKTRSFKMLLVQPRETEPVVRPVEHRGTGARLRRESALRRQRQAACPAWGAIGNGPLEKATPKPGPAKSNGIHSVKDGREHVPGRERTHSDTQSVLRKKIKK